VSLSSLLIFSFIPQHHLEVLTSCCPCCRWWVPAAIALDAALRFAGLPSLTGNIAKFLFRFVKMTFCSKKPGWGMTEDKGQPKQVWIRVDRSAAVLLSCAPDDPCARVCVCVQFSVFIAFFCSFTATLMYHIEGKCSTGTMRCRVVLSIQRLSRVRTLCVVVRYVADRDHGINESDKGRKIVSKVGPLYQSLSSRIIADGGCCALRRRSSSACCVASRCFKR
jgi:hypothetical protein